MYIKSNFRTSLGIISDRPEQYFAASAGSDEPAGSYAGCSARFQVPLFRQDLLSRQDLLFEQKFLLKQIIFLTLELIVISNFVLHIKSDFSVLGSVIFAKEIAETLFWCSLGGIF